MPVAARPAPAASTFTSPRYHPRSLASHFWAAQEQLVEVTGCWGVEMLLRGPHITRTRQIATIIATTSRRRPRSCTHHTDVEMNIGRPKDPVLGLTILSPQNTTSTSHCKRRWCTRTMPVVCRMLVPHERSFTSHTILDVGPLHHTRVLAADMPILVLLPQPPHTHSITPPLPVEWSWSRTFHRRRT